MFKRVRDFIYDINDIFIALIIVLAAAGVIVWRSVNIMNYPKYLANKPITTVEDVNFTDKDLEPVDPNASADPDEQGQNGPGQEQQGTVPGPDQSTKPDQSTTPDQQSGQQGSSSTPAEQSGNNSQEQSDGKKVITATINIESGFRGGWNTVVNRLVSAGLLKSTDKDAFIKKVISLKLDRSLRVGTYKLSSDMSYEQMIKTLCKAK